MKLEFFLGYSIQEQINSLHAIKDMVSDVLIQYAQEEDSCALYPDTVKNLTLIYMEANSLVSQVKAA